MARQVVIHTNDRKKYPVKSVVKIEKTTAGHLTKTVLSKQGKRRVSKRWRGIDKALRRMGEAQKTAASTYLERHERSNSKKKNGALRSIVKNLSKAHKKGRKKLKIKFL